MRPALIIDGRPRPFPFTNLDKVLFPKAGYTKGDLLRYYEKISPWLLPYLKDRPVTLERMPDGLVSARSPHFWQKNTPASYPDWIPRVLLPTERGKGVAYALVNDLETLLYLVNQGTITFHVFFSTVHDLACPDFVMFDLDIGRATFANVVTVAQQIHQVLDQEKVGAQPKTSGKTGLHIIVPWAQRSGYQEARDWAMNIARKACTKLPQIATTNRQKGRRGKRVYVDVIQNALGHHAAPPYVVRATPRATVSMPLEWADLTPQLDPSRFDMDRVLERMARRR